jgi:hypothetical protein
MSQLITLATYNSRVEAELVKGLLLSNDVHAVIMADDEGGMMAYPFSLVKGVRVIIAEKDLKLAKAIIQNRGTKKK